MVAERARPARRPGGTEAPVEHQPRPPPRRRQHKKRAIAVYRSLEAAGVAERRRDADGRCAGVRVGSLVEGSDERAALRFSAPLMPFAIEVIATFDRDDPAYVLDVVSVVEAVLDDPRQILYAQQNAAKGAEVARHEGRGRAVRGADGAARRHHVAEAAAASCSRRASQPYRGRHPWVADGPSPKSILREMLEGGDTFASFVRRYRLERSEGLVLRYLTDAWRTLDRSLPDDVYTEALEDVVEWLGALIRATDATLLDEWARLAGKPVHDHLAPDAAAGLRTGPPAGVAHRRAHRGVRMGRAAWRDARYAALAERSRLGRGTPARGDGALLGRVRRHRHRRRRPLGRALPAHRGARVGGRSSRHWSTPPATASGGWSRPSTSTSRWPRVRRRCASSTSAHRSSGDA